MIAVCTLPLRRMLPDDHRDGSGRCQARAEDRRTGSPIYLPPELTESGQRELAGYLLNDAAKGYACTFLDTSSNLCSIYENQP
ncbi:MAG TPA: hypothetical protein VKU02_20990 [Gemmataceae bacterium]|nr:hypothetical protein [Gemmataceae bacterium]